MNRSVLISGGGIAGSTVAYWLARHGFTPTVVERSGGARSSGSPVDVKGPAVRVVTDMGVMDRLRAARTATTGLTFVDRAGRRVGRISTRALAGKGGDQEVEVPRADLATVLYEAGRDHAEYLWDDSIAALDSDERGVTVTFDRAGPRRFDLVIGADGLHSNTRRLVFGPEGGFVHHMGMYVATMPFDGPPADPTRVVMYNSPGRAASISPVPAGAIAFFAFRSPPVAGFHYRDSALHKRLLANAYRDGGWRVPELIAHLDSTDDLFFDSVSQARVPDWSRGRIALLGDAASCVSLFGDGSTLAIAGAYTLAAELAASPGDHVAAFRRYEAVHRRLVDPRQRGIRAAAALIVPGSAAAIRVRNLASRLSPLLAAAGSLRRPAVALPVAG